MQWLSSSMNLLSAYVCFYNGLLNLKPEIKDIERYYLWFNAPQNIKVDLMSNRSLVLVFLLIRCEEYTVKSR